MMNATTSMSSRSGGLKTNLSMACAMIGVVGLVLIRMRSFHYSRRRLATGIVSSQVGKGHHAGHHHGNSDGTSKNIGILVIPGTNIPIMYQPQQLKKAEIPKIIHQIYLGYNANLEQVSEIPEQQLRWREDCRFINSEYEMKLWNKPALEQLIQTKYEFMWETWQSWSTEWIKQADAARYVVINEFGGIYMDLDYSCHAPLDGIIANASIVLNRGLPGGEQIEYIDNSFMASTPHHWFWGNVLPVVVRRANWNVLAATGPHMLSRVLYDVCGKTPEVRYDPSHRTEYYDPDVEKFGIVLATTEMKQGVIKHHNMGTWLGLYQK